MLLLLIIGCADKNIQLTTIATDQYAIDSSITQKSSIESFLLPYKTSLDSSMQLPLSYNPVSMHKKQTPYNTAIGNMMAEIVLTQAQPIFEQRTGKNIDMVLLNHGGIRAPLAKGAVTMRNAYEIMPFENNIVVVEMKGQDIEKMIEYLVRKEVAHPFTGLQITLSDSGTTALVNGLPVQSDKIYYVATNDYLYNGGDNMEFFKDLPLYRVDYKIRNALIDYFKKTDTLRFVADNRFTSTRKNG